MTHLKHIITGTTLIAFIIGSIIILNCAAKTETLADKISLANVWLTMLSAATIIIASTFALTQLKEATKSRELSTFVTITELLQKEEVRIARQTIFAITDGRPDIKPLIEWTANEKEAAHKVLNSFDLIGLLIKQELLNASFIVNWEYAIKKSIAITNEYLESIRKDRGGKNYFPGIEVLKDHFF